VVAPCTTRAERTGEVPVGGVLFTKKSPAYGTSGLHAEVNVISVRNAALYTIDSHFIKNCKQIGVIDTELDKHFRDNLRDLMKVYDLVHSKNVIS